MKSILSLQITLPEHYRIDDFFTFHQRDKLNISEQVSTNKLCKGIMWDQLPACFTLQFINNNAIATLEVDGTADTLNEDSLKKFTYHLLGLYQNVDAFEDYYHHDEIIGKLIIRQKGLRIYQSSTPFEAINWAIIGQQISVHAAISIRRRLIQYINIRHSSGINCYPDFTQLLQLREDDLKSCGFSKSKASALITLCEQLANEKIKLPLVVDENNVAEVSQQLMAIKGIGLWTVNYALLRGFNYLNGSLHGDVAVRRNIQHLLNLNDKVTAIDAEEWLQTYSPWRALMAAHLWRQESSAGY